MISHRRLVCWAVLLFSILLLTGVVFKNHVFAQGDDTSSADNSATGAGVAEGSFFEDPVDQNQKKNDAQIGAILREGVFNPPAKQNFFDDYYTTYALARWTQVSSLGNLSKFRKELFNNLRQTKGAQVYNHLNDLVLKFMEERAKSDKYHPAVRYNAMLTIGDLNSAPGMQPPPLEAALPVLLSTVNDNKQIEPVKIAALIGINRHVSPPAGVSDPQVQNQVLAAMLKIVAGSDSAETSDPGRQWMRKQATEILGSLGSLGNNNQVVQVLNGIVADGKALLSVRTAAAKALGQLKYGSPTAIKSVDLGKTLCQLMLDACTEELNAVRTDRPVSRRRLKSVLGPVTEGMNAVKSLAKEQAQQTYFNNLQSVLDDLLKDLDNAKLENQDLQKSVQNCQTRLRIWLEKNP